MKLFDEFEQEIDFSLPDDVRKIGVNCSGGADSSILLFMVCDYLIQNKMNDTTVSVVTCANDYKHRWNVRKAADVINYVIEKLNFNQIDVHYSYYRDLQKVEYFHEFEGKLFEDKRIDMMCSGITSNPKVEVILEDSRGKIRNITKDGLPDRVKDNAPQMLVGSDGRRFYHPFVNVDKRFIAAMYKKYEVEDLFDLTRSCEAIPSPDAPFDPEFENTPCGHCWWCLERKWAFGRL